MTATVTPTKPCAKAVEVSLVCAGSTSVSAPTFQIKLVSGTVTGSCGAVTSAGSSLLDIVVDPASVADESPYDETPFSCVTALQQLAADIAESVNALGGNTFEASVTDLGSVRIVGQVDFSCLLCTDEASLPCSGASSWPIGICGLGNLGDGVSGNESSFTATNYNGLTTGLGVISLDTNCP